MFKRRHSPILCSLIRVCRAVFSRTGDEIDVRVLATRVTFETLPKGRVPRHATLGL